MSDVTARQSIRCCLIVLAATVACATDEHTVVPPPPPPPAPLVLSVAPAGRTATAVVGLAAPDENATILLTGDNAWTTPWTVSARHAWTSVTAAAGIGGGITRWTRNTSGLAVGVYVDTITVAVVGAIGSPQAIYDTLRIVAAPTGPAIVVSPASRSVVVPWGDTAATGTAMVTLVGTGTSGNYWWSVSKKKNWNNADASNHTDGGGPFSWKRNVTGLAVGTYVDTMKFQLSLQFTATGAPVTVYDSLTIAPGPGPFTLTASPLATSASAAVGAGAPAASAVVTLTGKNAIHNTWTAAKTRPWTTLTGATGTGSGTVAWTRSTAGLAAGIYYDTITVTAPGAFGSPFVIADTFRVTGPAPVGPFTLSSNETWAGSTVKIRASAFHARGTGALVHFGSIAVPVVRVDDSTMSVKIPTMIGGTSTPDLELDGYHVALPALTVDGYADMQSFVQNIGYDAYAWPRGGHAIIMGASSDYGSPVRSGLTFFDLDTHTSTTYDSVITQDILRGPGATYQDSVYVLGGGDALKLWRLGSPPTLIGPVPAGVSSFRQAMQLGPNAWFLSSHHQFSVLQRSDATQPWQGTSTVAEETEGVFMSPRHDRATITVDHDASGVPVFDASGQIAFVTPLQSSEGVDFSRDGSLLAMVGGAHGFAEDVGRIVLMNATTGAVLGDTTIDRIAWAVTLDPVRPLLYVGVAGPGPLATILILDRNTFRTVGEMSVPQTLDECGNFGSFCYKGVLALNAQNGLYLFWSFSGPTRAYRFTLPAGTGIP